MQVLLSWITLATVFSGGQIVAGQGGPTITCDCSTDQCIQQKKSVCITEGLCFTQYLDRGLQGAPSLLRGCTDKRTPLLCENRKPSKAKTWPLLHCCSTDFCNRDAVPTPMPRGIIEGGHILKAVQVQNIANRSGDEFISLAVPESSPSSLLSSPEVQQRRNINNPWPHIVSPVYVSVLVLGIVSLIIIGIVAATVIRKSNSNRFYEEHYGTLEFRRDKAVVRCDCDSDIESVASSQPYLHMMCPNRRDT